MLLAIDTSTRYAGVALWSDDAPVAAVCWRSRHNHTSELMPTVQYLLDRAGATIDGLEGIGVALGPGGFSAVRVGLSVAKGLALPRSIPLVGVGTLEMEAYPYAGTGMPVCPILDAGKAEVASAVFQAGPSADGWRKLADERISTPEELVASVSKRTLLCGEGVPARAEYLKEALGRRALVVGFHTPASRLWALGVLARERLHRGDADDLAALQPLYLRRPSIGRPATAQKVRL